MSVKITQPIPPNVVEIGNEITQGVVDGLMSASPSASNSNPYATLNNVNGVFLPLAGGTMAGDIGVNYNDLNQVTSIVFADSTVQTTAPVWGNGQGVPAGGTAGQVLAKIDGTDYNTEWVNGGGGINPADGFTLNSGAIIDTTQGTITAGNVSVAGIINAGTIDAGPVNAGYLSVAGNVSVSGTIDAGPVVVGDYLSVAGNVFVGGNVTLAQTLTSGGTIACGANGQEIYIGYDSTIGYAGTGIIWSVSGGFQFPDNSIQTTAAVSPADGFTLNSGATIDTTQGTINAGNTNIVTGSILNIGDGSPNVLMSLNAIITANSLIYGNLGLGGLQLYGEIITNNLTINQNTDTLFQITGNDNQTFFNYNSSIGGYFQNDNLNSVLIYNYNDGSNTYGVQTNNLIWSTNGGYKFPDETIQTTAAVSGDRYKTTSTTSNTIDNGNGKSFFCDTGLSYTPLQSCVIYSESNPSAEHMHCTVVSYDTSTGELVVDVNTHIGNGTHTDWVINK